MFPYVSTQDSNNDACDWRRSSFRKVTYNPIGWKKRRVPKSALAKETIPLKTAWAAPRGYAFVTGRSRKSANGRQQVVFNCDRGSSLHTNFANF